MGTRKIEPVVRIYKMGQEPNDFTFWQSRPVLERLEAFAEIRREYNVWKYGIAEPRLERVYRIIKQKPRQVSRGGRTRARVTRTSAIKHPDADKIWRMLKHCKTNQQRTRGRRT
jgi:hypothetical protein